VNTNKILFSNESCKLADKDVWEKNLDGRIFSYFVSCQISEILSGQVLYFLFDRRWAGP
jgi:hypothetical protein